MDIQKYISILENKINKIKEMLQKINLQWDNDSTISLMQLNN